MAFLRGGRLAVSISTALLLAAVVAAPSSAAPASAAADTLRGTEAPLPHRVSPLHHAARGMLFVPYTALRVAVWPVSRLAYLDERYHLVRTLGSLVTFTSGPYRSSVGPLFNFESSLGVTVLGLNVRGRDWLGSGLDLKLGLGYVNKRKYLLAAGLERDEGPVRWEALFHREQMDERHFHGVGPRSSPEQADYGAELHLVEIIAAANPEGTLKPELTLYVRDVRLLAADEDLSVSEAFPDLFDVARQVRYAGVEAGLAYDTRNCRDYSNRGGLVRLRGGWNDSRRFGDADYRHYSAELQYFIDLYHGSRVLLLRGHAEGVVPEGDGELPLTELARLGGRTGLRGYGRSRFADRRSLVLTAAYRYPVTARVQGELFVDWGSVAPTWDKLSLGDIDPCAGLGLAVGLRETPLFTLQVAFSHEDVQVAVGTTSIFKTRTRRQQ